MLLGAAWAGTAIENSMLGAAHAAANPLTAHFGIVHGEAVGLMLPAVVQFNAQDPAVCSLYADLARAAGLAASNSTPEQAVGSLLATLQSLRAAARLPKVLSERDVTAASIPSLATDAASQWTAHFNPRPVAPADFERLYHTALGPLDLPAPPRA
jgi:alcohol dehydrogenase